MSDPRETLARIGAQADAAVPRLVDVLEAVLDTHPRSPNTRAIGFPRADRDEYYCMEDQKSWPCPTVALITALEGETND